MLAACLNSLYNNQPAGGSVADYDTAGNPAGLLLLVDNEVVVAVPVELLVVCQHHFHGYDAYY